jgi:hypothetical protein
MRKMCAAVLGLGFFVSATAFGAEFSTLEERMSQTEFQAAGLNRLSPEEMKALNDWLRVHGLAPGAPVASGSGQPEFYPDHDEREPVESRIVGAFNGWMGKTKFNLENGQVWEQAESGMRGESLQNPAVRIRPMLLGSWLMYIDGCGCSVRVKRIK